MEHKKSGNKSQATVTKGANESNVDRMSVEAEMAKQKKIMAQVEELASIGSWEWDMKNDTWLFSDNWIKMHGCANSQLTTSDLMLIAHPEDRPAIAEAFTRATENGEPYNIQHRIIRQDTGEIRHVQAQGIVEYDDFGKQKSLIGVAQDITGRMQTEKALRESEEKFRILAQSAKVMISIVGDPKAQKFLYVNDEWCRLHGYSKEEALNLKPIDIIAPDYRQTVLDHAAKRLNGEDPPGNYELKIITKSGEIRYLDFSSTIINFGNQKAFLTTSIDITDRKQAEESLIESEEQLKAIFENSLNPIMIADDAGNYLKVNQAASKMFQYPVEQLLQMNVGDLRTASSKDAATRYQEYLENGYDIGELDIIHPDGSWAIAHYQAVRIRENFNLSILSDITEWKRAEKALRESEERFKNMFERHSAIMLLIDPETGAILDANDSATTFYGYSRSELLSMQIDDINALSPDEIKKQRMHALHNNQNYFIFRHKIANGEIRAVEVHSSPIPFKKSQILFSVIHDITERKQAEEALRKSEAIKNKMVSNIGDVIVIIDKDGINRYKSPNVEKWFGWKPEDLVGKSTWDNIHPEDIEASQSFLQSLADEPNASGTMKLRYRKKDGSYSPIEINAVNLLQDPDIQGFLGNYRDITDIKEKEKLEAEILIANKSLQFKQNFLANMSHEIRTPLTGVLGMIEIMEQTSLTDDQKDYLDTIKVSGEHLREIINQVLDYSKIEAGKVRIHPRVFKFTSLPSGAISLYKNNAKPGVEFHHTLDPEIPDWIEADKARLSQVLNNLVSNAVKFTTQGSISVQSSLFSSNVEKGKVMVKIEVTDTGPGIPESLHKKLFVPFSQIEYQDTRNYEGTGLGLAICKQLIGMMAGEIGMSSQEGKGSTFWFTFPARIAQKKQADVQKNDTPVSGQKLCILLVEDKIVNQKVIKLMLTSMGHEVLIANNGQESIELYQPGKFNLILMDIQMPVMDGVTATQKLKEKHAILPPIVGLSANAFEGDRTKYMALGMDEYLTKPVKRTDFERLAGSLF